MYNDKCYNRMFVFKLSTKPIYKSSPIKNHRLDMQELAYSMLLNYYWSFVL